MEEMGNVFFTIICNNKLHKMASRNLAWNKKKNKATNNATAAVTTDATATDATDATTSTSGATSSTSTATLIYAQKEDGNSRRRVEYTFMDRKAI